MPRADPPKRTATLPQMAALRAPPVAPDAEAPLPPKQKAHATLTGLPAPAADGSAPPPPRVPGDFAPTLPAPKDPPLKKTWRLPTPPSAARLARRTDPPVTGEPSSEPDASTGQPGASLPPLSQDPEETIQDALRRRAEAAEGKIAAANARAEEAERRRRVQLETASSATYPPAVTPSVAPEAPTKAPESGAASEGSTKALRSALTKLVLGLAALLALLGLPLTAYIQALTTQIQRSTAQATQANARADAVEVKAGTNTKEQNGLERAFRQYRSNRRELDRLQGIEYPKVEGDPEPDQLEPYAPLCPAGKVCPGAQLILKKAP
jgi:hypothetical protein